MFIKLAKWFLNRFYVPPALKRIMERIYYCGNRFTCPCCGGRFRKMQSYEGDFYAEGEFTDPAAKNHQCPRCGSYMRHRFYITFLLRHSDILKKPIRLCFFAPDICVCKFLDRQKNIDYVPCDIDPFFWPGAIKVDITDIQFPDNSFDAVIATHVLEHIKDDTKALKEVYRIIKPGGWALILIPTYGEKTYEDQSLDFSGRGKMYGRGDHWRKYGLDFRSKLASAGFRVSLYSFDDVPGKYIDRGVKSPLYEINKYLFFCEK